jgi:2,4-dienoyl-CoA reductase-like NADH-dependent reductase (Old Yellow Enzyme family)
MASFLSPLNERDDCGGPKEQRVRLPLEVFARVRAEVGRDYTVGCRFLTEECIEGGNTLEDSSYFAVQFARGGMDFLSLSRGGKFEDAQQPKVRAAGFATPVVVSGGIHNFEQAEAVLAQGYTDIVGLARQALADPD